jgi:hypothetical protein
MVLRRRQPPPPCPCRCAELADRVAEYETLLGAFARAIVALRPIARWQSVVQGLVAWGVSEADARLIAGAWQRKP